MFIVAFPISDNEHFMVGIIPSFIGSIYLLDKFAKMIYSKINKRIKLIKVVNYIKYFLESASVLFVVFFIVYGTYGLIKEYNNDKYFCQLKHFENIPTTVESEQWIRTLGEYVANSDKKVYILNFDAALYMIPIDKYNKDYDMFMNGNFGGKGSEGLIERIKTEKNVQYIILNRNYPRNWQNPFIVTDYIENNLVYKGNIGRLDIYEPIEE